eukprot:763448-Hanusia_phi.AAC.7
MSGRGEEQMKDVSETENFAIKTLHEQREGEGKGGQEMRTGMGGGELEEEGEERRTEGRRA